MSFKNKLMVLALAWALLGASNALAKAHDHGNHQHPQNTIVSPFNGEKEVRSLHCVLRSHTHQGFCPHSKPERSQTANIATDCGGKTTPSIPNTTSFSNDSGEASFLTQNHYSPDKMLVPSDMLSYHRFIDSLDPPPRVL